MTEKKRTQLHVHVPADLLAEFDAFCRDRGLWKKRQVEIALRQFLARQKRRRR